MAPEQGRAEDVAAQVLGVAGRDLTVRVAGNDQRWASNPRLQAGVHGIVEVVEKSVAHLHRPQQGQHLHTIARTEIRQHLGAAGSRQRPSMVRKKTPGACRASAWVKRHVSGAVHELNAM